MRRKISLYIDGALADLKDQGLVLFNYSLTDLQKPTAVKNSYSKKLTLPGTPANDRIFSFAGRLDRETVPGSFNAGTRTPFQIMDDTGTIIESGYLRLDSVKRRGKVVDSYEVSLFGGLGSFFYMLSQNDDGTKMTLADLVYLDALHPEDELQFTINASEVNNAWFSLQSATPLFTRWRFINYIPAYEGVPEGDFDADKMITNTDYLPAQQGYHRDNYGNTVVKYPEKLTGFEAHDFRSYQQRPALSVYGMLKGIQNTAEILGYEFDYSSIPEATYSKLWKTLPLITSIPKVQSREGALTTSGLTQETKAIVAGHWYLSGLTTFANTSVHATVSFSLGIHSTYYNSIQLYAQEWDSIALFVCQVIGGTDAVDAVGSDIWAIGPHTVTLTPAQVQQALSLAGYTPPKEPGAYHYVGTRITSTGGWHYLDEPLTIEVEGANVNYCELRIVGFSLGGSFVTGETPTVTGATFRSGGCIPPTLWSYGGLVNYANVLGLRASEISSSATYKTATVPRSGATITKRMLLSTSKTPAEYLISLAKQFGWHFIADRDRKRVSLLTREDFFKRDEPVIDLSDRIDRGKDMTVTPLSYKSKWYTFLLDVAAGAWAEEYKSLYGVEHGIQRVDTGYDFDAEVTNLLEGNAFRAAASVLESSKYMCGVRYGNQYPYPAALLYPGAAYTLWDDVTGEAKEFPAPVLPSYVSPIWYNGDFPGYDLSGVSRIQLHTKDKKAIAGEDILVKYCGNRNLSDFAVTDDSPEMLIENNGKPCWDKHRPYSNYVSVPTFSRFDIVNGEIADSLDMGPARELSIPAVTLDADAFMYAKHWRNYISDVLDKDARVMKCRVHLDGLQAGPELLRRFYFYEGAIWALNKISNYSLTTYDATECEFIKVKDIENYR